jgi:hypothetical protein
MCNCKKNTLSNIYNDKPKTDCQEVKEIINNINPTNTIKYLAYFAHKPEFSFETFYILKDYPELYNYLLFNKTAFNYFKKIFYGDYKLYEIILP